MVAFQLFAGLLALASPLMVLADVTPIGPGPGSVFKTGSTCLTTWQGDTDSSTVWENMAIELMSGSNSDMVHVSTIATNQDGTKDGSFQYPCPAVTPNSAIYFYQYSSPNTATKTWTTRFLIEAADGSSTAPANSKQPSGDSIPWGIGSLVDSSAAVPPPFSGSNSTSSSANSSLPSASSTPLPTNSMIVVTSSFSSSGPASGTSSANGSTATSGALANAVNDRRIWMTAIGAFAAAFI